MSGAARIQKDLIEVGLLAAPAALLRQQLGRLAAELQPPLTPLLLQNPVLLLQVLAQARAAAPTTNPLPALLQELPGDAAVLQSLLRQSGLQLLLTETIPDQTFLANHWLLSRRTALCAAALARCCGYPSPQLAEACGLLLRAGMLVLLQQHGSDAGKLVQDHVETGVALLERLGLDQFSVDALRYQALPAVQLLDAAPLVKLCWLAAREAESTMPPDASELLPALTPAVLAGIRTEVAATLAAECRQLGLPWSAAQSPSPEVLAQSGRQQVQLLRQQLLALDSLSTHAAGEVQTPLELQQRLAALLQDAGFAPVFLVLQSTAGAADTLQVVVSQGLGADPAGLELVCRPKRSALADLVLRGDVDTLSLANADLAVLDRQLLRLLGGSTVLCEPVQSKDRRAVLLAGLGVDGAGQYLGHATLRRLLRSTLLAALRPAASDAGASDLMLYRQRVREAVHEANNPLTIIKSYLHLLGLKQGAEVAAEVALLRQEIDRVAGILHDLREPAAGAVTGPLDLNALVGSMHRLFAGAWGQARESAKGIRFELALAPDPVTVLAVADAVKQILTNLVKNAVEAIEGSGIIVISTRTNVWQQGRLYSQLTVADNGPGIAPALLQQLFSRGLTTRSGPGKGSGLSIVKRLVDNLQGQISCQSDRNGTVWTLLLPQAS